MTAACARQPWRVGYTCGCAVRCADCGLAYSDPAWLDATIPTHDWLAISPTGHEGGVLCITCMTRRLAAAGRSHVPVKVYSGANTLVMASAEAGGAR